MVVIYFKGYSKVYFKGYSKVPTILKGKGYSKVYFKGGLFSGSMGKGGLFSGSILREGYSQAIEISWARPLLF